MNRLFLCDNQYTILQNSMLSTCNFFFNGSAVLLTEPTHGGLWFKPGNN
jgi:hypothetical protein